MKQKGPKVTIEQFRTTQRAQPFVPFTMHLADGRKHHVTHPDFVASHPQGRTVFVFKPGETGDYEAIDLLLVVGLEVHQSKQNGRQRKTA